MKAKKSEVVYEMTRPATVTPLALEVDRFLAANPLWASHSRSAVVGGKPTTMLDAVAMPAFLRWVVKEGTLGRAAAEEIYAAHRRHNPIEFPRPTLFGPLAGGSYTPRPEGD